MSAAVNELAAAILSDPDSFIQERARRRLLHFTNCMVAGYDAAPHIADLLVPALEKVTSTPNGRLIVTMPPRHSKSLHVSENLPAWYLGRHPEHRIIAASHTAQLAYTFSRRVRNKIQDPRYPFETEVADDKGAVQAWDTSEGGGYLAVGAGGSPTGSGGNGIIIDDPIRSAADADSQTVRDSLWEWYQGTMRTRLEPQGWIIVTATRWHEDDLTGRLLAEAEKGGEKWEHLYLPALNDASDALWPDRWDVDALDAIKRSVGSRAWAAQYQGNPVPSEGGMFKRHWWKYVRSVPTLRQAIITVDSAFKDGVENDASVFALWGTDGEGNAYLMRRWKARVAFPELIRMGHEAHAYASRSLKGMNIPLVVEDKASGQSAIQVWSRPYQTGSGTLPALPVVPFTVKGGQSKVARAEGVTALVEGGRVHLLEGEEWIDDFITEHEQFPTGKHDDQVDTTSMALTRLNLGKKKGYWGAL